MVRRNCIAQAPMARVRDPVNGVSVFPLATRRARERAEMHVIMLIIWVLLRVPAEVGAADARPPTKGETRSIALILSDAAHEAITLDLAARLRGMQLMTILLSANTAVCAEDLAALARAAAGAHQVAHIAPVLVGPGMGVDHAFRPTEERLEGLPITLHHGVACHHGVTLDHDRAAPDTGLCDLSVGRWRMGKFRSTRRGAAVRPRCAGGGGVDAWIPVGQTLAARHRAEHGAARRPYRATPRARVGAAGRGLP
jgi:hypothetical protein